MKTINVVAAIIIQDHRTFATQRGYGAYKDRWEFPGGKVEPGEKPEDAIVREIKDLRYTVLVIEPVAGCAKPLRVNISGGLWDRLRHEKQLYASVASSDIMLLNN